MPHRWNKHGRTWASADRSKSRTRINEEVTITVGFSSTTLVLLGPCAVLSDTRAGVSTDPFTLIRPVNVTTTQKGKVEEELVDVFPVCFEFSTENISVLSNDVGGRQPGMGLLKVPTVRSFERE